jgi:hypothetical protein
MNNLYCSHSYINILVNILNLTLYTKMMLIEGWCQKSAFHKSNSKEKAYKNADEEFKGFAEAIVRI